MRQLCFDQAIYAVELYPKGRHMAKSPSLHQESPDTTGCRDAAGMSLVRRLCLTDTTITTWAYASASTSEGTFSVSRQVVTYLTFSNRQTCSIQQHGRILPLQPISCQTLRGRLWFIA